MADNDIMKALECCINDDCDNCPDTFGNCEHNAMRNALDLINRQKAEIGRLSEIINLQKERNNTQSRTIKAQTRVVKALERQNNIAKAEAVKEFVKLVIKNIRKQVNPIPQQRYLVEMCIKVIRSLAKEMAGEVDG